MTTCVKSLIGLCMQCSFTVYPNLKIMSDKSLTHDHCTDSHAWLRSLFRKCNVNPGHVATSGRQSRLCEAAGACSAAVSCPVLPSWPLYVATWQFSFYSQDFVCGEGLEHLQRRLDVLTLLGYFDETPVQLKHQFNYIPMYIHIYIKI